MSSKEFRNNSTRLHRPRKALQGNFREDGVRQSAIMAAKLRKAASQKDPQKVEREALYRAFLKGLD